MELHFTYRHRGLQGTSKIITLSSARLIVAPNYSILENTDLLYVFVFAFMPKLVSLWSFTLPNLDYFIQNKKKRNDNASIGIISAVNKLEAQSWLSQ